MEGVVMFLIPIAFIAAISVPVCLLLYFSYRTRVEIQQTVRSAVEHGQQLTPDFLERLGESSLSPAADFRRGVIAIAIGLGIAALGILGGDEIYDRWTIVGIGALPLIIGLAYLGLWRFSPRN